MKKGIWITACLLAGLMTFSPTSRADAADQVTIRALTGNLGGSLQVAFGVFGNTLLKNNPGWKYEMMPGGVVGNAIRLSNGEADIADLQHCLQQAALKGINPYKKPILNVSAIANLREINSLHIMVRDEVPIYSIEDIFDGRSVVVAPGAVGGACYAFATWVIEAYGHSWSDITKNGGKVLSNTFSDVGNMLKDGQVDVFFWNGPGEVGFVQEYITSKKVRWLPISAEKLEKLEKEHLMLPTVIKADMYGGAVGKDTPSVTAPAGLICRSDMPEEVVYRLTKTVCENWDDVKAGFYPWSEFIPERGWEGNGFPLHPGAERYYRERGWLK